MSESSGGKDKLSAGNNCVVWEGGRERYQQSTRRDDEFAGNDGWVWNGRTDCLTVPFPVRTLTSPIQASFSWHSQWLTLSTVQNQPPVSGSC